MLTDAVAAEGYKFIRDRNILFWGFCFVPLAVLLFNTAAATYLRLWGGGVLSFGHTVDLGPQIIDTIGLGGSSFFQIFFAVGATSIFVSEYRWETWRILTPRNGRVNLIIAKFIIYSFACASTLAALAVVGLVDGLYGSLMDGTRPVLALSDFLGKALVVFLVTCGELLILCTVIALVAVASRAMIAALLAGMFFSFGQDIAMVFVDLWNEPLIYFAVLPGMSAYPLRAWALGQEVAPGVFVDPHKVLPLCCFLVAWILVLAGAASYLFKMQDLPRE